MCGGLCDPKARRCKCDKKKVSARSKARYKAKKAAGLTRAPLKKTAASVPAQAPLVTASTRDIDTLRALAANIDEAFAGEDQGAWQALSKEYGSPLGAIRALGSALTSRAEELAGVDADRVVASWQSRREVAEQVAEETRLAARARGEEDMREFDAWATEHHPGIDWQETSGEGSLRALRNAYVSDEFKASIAARDTAVDFWESSCIKFAGDTQTKEDLRRLADGYQEALAEVRPLGGRLSVHDLSDASAIKVVKEAISIYPADWVAASAAAGPLAVVETSGRSMHTPTAVASDRVAKGPRYLISYVGNEPRDTPEREHLSVEKGMGERGADAGQDRWLIQDYEVKRVSRRPNGADWEQLEPKVWRRKVRGSIDGPGLELNLSGKGDRVQGRPKGFAVTAHELGHRMHSVVPGLSAMEDSWLTDRTTVNGERDELVPLWEGSAEMVRPDNFVEAYIGKEYTDFMGDIRDATEVITMGTQGMFGGDHGGLIGMGQAQRDDDMRHFILGAMASAGGRAQ